MSQKDPGTMPGSSDCEYENAYRGDNAPIASIVHGSKEFSFEFFDTGALYGFFKKLIQSLLGMIRLKLRALLAELEISGPVRGNWSNYGKLSKTRHHCHLKKGNPTYVAVWEEGPQGIQFIEVTYVGTHEKAPY